MPRHRFKTKRNCSGRLLLLVLLPVYIVFSLISYQWHVNREDHHMAEAVHQLMTLTKSRFSYAFVLGGCDPETNPTYRFFIYNMLVAAKILREHGSTSDIVCLLQISSASNYTRLPTEDARWLKEMNIRVLYIPKQHRDNFYRISLEKFRILGLTEYDRVLLMDGDVMPAGNLDYLFEMSVNGSLKENVAIQGKAEPVNAGFFMLKPNRSDLRQVNQIIQSRAEEARQMEFPYFDDKKGWGHVIEPGDEWTTAAAGPGRDWSFHAGFSDQGLLFHWVKYRRSCVSIIKRNGLIEHWYRDINGSLIKDEVQNPMPAREVRFRLSRSALTKAFPPFGDFVHFTGESKPWLVELPETENELSEPKLYEIVRIWRRHLQQVAEDIQMALNFEEWSLPKNKPSLGFGPSKRDIVDAGINLLEGPFEY